MSFLSLYLQWTEKMRSYFRTLDKIATTYTAMLIEVNYHIKPFWANTISKSHTSAFLKLLVANKPQKHEKYETDRILTQKHVKKHRRKCNLILKNKTLRNTYYKLTEQKG